MEVKSKERRRRERERRERERRERERERKKTHLFPFHPLVDSFSFPFVSVFPSDFLQIIDTLFPPFSLFFSPARARLCVCVCVWYLRTSTAGSYKVIRTLLRHKLLHHENIKYDGYRLTTLGYDYLALRALCARGVITGVGRQIGVGKESDVYEVVDEEGNLRVCKFHRLGRTSFRAVKAKRDYLKHRQNYSWLYLSRLAALKEFAFMRALGEHGLPVPEAIDHNRHCVVMSIIEARPLSQLSRLNNPGKVYKQITENMVNLAKLGLVHCDFNEFNIMVNDDEDITVIDFPQMVSIKHENASHLFQRDVDCIVKFFERKVKYRADEEELGMLAYPTLEEIMEDMDLKEDLALDKQLAASGFKGRLLDDEEDGDDDDDDDDDDGESEENEASGGGEVIAEADAGLEKDLDEMNLEQVSGDASGEASASDLAGELDGLLEFAQHFDREEENQSIKSDSLDRVNRKASAPSKSRGKLNNKSKGKSNSNKDKSGRRHDGVKHKIRISKSDY